MLSAAFSSRSSTSSQDGQTWVRTDRLLATRSRQRLPSGNTPNTLRQAWLVYWAGTAITHLPASAALHVRMLRNAAQAAPVGIADALGQVVVAHQVADLQVF